VSLEEYIVKKLDARIDSLEQELEELSARLKKTEERLSDIDGHYVDMGWFEAVLAKLHPEIKEEGWYDDVL